MHPIVEQMLSSYPVTNVYDKKNAIKEILQEIVLCGLSRSGFFRSSAFYGGTALRIFYGLDRFSEDLDFSLQARDEMFHLTDHFPQMERELRAYGFSFRVETKEKTHSSDIHSAFLKGGTREHLLLIDPEDPVALSVSPNEQIKIKFEIDTNPPGGATFETRYRLLPIPYEITLYDEPSLFAGKLHAVLCRAWKSRVKGRDLYDYVFYRSRSTPVNLAHLSARLYQSGFLPDEKMLSIPDLEALLCDRFSSIDYEQAKQDVIPFIKNPAALEVWKTDFFHVITKGLTSSPV